jgi:hypothetical protein
MNTEEMLEALTKANEVMADYCKVITIANLYAAHQMSAEVAMHEIKTTIMKES